jgi:hypothetical protein
MLMRMQRDGITTEIKRSDEINARMRNNGHFIERHVDPYQVALPKWVKNFNQGV